LITAITKYCLGQKLKLKSEDYLRISEEIAQNYPMEIAVMIASG